MLRHTHWMVALSSAAFLTVSVLSSAAEPAAGPEDVYGARVQASPVAVAPLTAERRSSQAVDGFRYWNQVAVDASGLDHTPVTPSKPADSASSSDPAGRHARWRSCTSRCSMR